MVCLRVVSDIPSVCMKLQRHLATLLLSRSNSLFGLLARVAVRVALWGAVVVACLLYTSNHAAIGALFLAVLAASGISISGSSKAGHIVLDPAIVYWRNQTPWLWWASGWAVAMGAVGGLLAFAFGVMTRLGRQDSFASADLLGDHLPVALVACWVAVPTWIAAARGPIWARAAGVAHGVALACAVTVQAETALHAHAPAHFGLEIYVLYACCLALTLIGVGRTVQLRRQSASCTPP